METERTNKIKLLNKIKAVSSGLYIQKTGEHTMGGNYKYAEHDVVVAKIRRLIHENGMVVTPSFSGSEYSRHKVKDKEVTSERLDVTLTIHDCETGYSMTSDAPGCGSDYGAGDKAVGKAMSSAFKHALMKFFMAEAGKETDIEHDLAEIKQKIADCPLILQEMFSKHQVNRAKIVWIGNKCNWDYEEMVTYVRDDYNEK